MSKFNSTALREKNEAGQRKAEIVLIHVAKKQLGLDDESYRALLQGATGLASAANMDMTQREAVIAALEKAGFKRTGGGAARRNATPKPKKVRPPKLRLITSLWIQLRETGDLADPSDKALNNFILGQTGVAHIDWIDAKQQDQVIDSLRMWFARVKLALLNG